MAERVRAQMSRIFVIMVGFGPKRQIEASLRRFQPAYEAWPCPRNTDLNLIFVNGHFPLNYKDNQDGLRELVESFGFKFLDPGKDIGSAQSQHWALEQVGAEDGDYWINLDPDSACDNPNWLKALFSTIESCPDIAILSLNSFWFWERVLRLGALPVENRFVGPYRVWIPLKPDLFNLSIWRVGPIFKIGGIAQGTPFWGNVEGPMRHALSMIGYKTAILYDFTEATDLKTMQPMEFIEWKFSHGITRTFLGSFGDYCKKLGLT